MSERYRARVYWLALILLLSVTWLIYAPGLRGGFLFDDFANLPALGALGPINNWPAFWRYITSGIADPFGRPLAMLSFLLDAHDWPANPFPFKRSNLILHLFNGLLLSLLLRRIGQTVATTEKSYESGSVTRLDLAAVLGAGFWLMHPLLVSTTLYIVQREAMLSTTFILLGLLAWLRGRHAVICGRTLKGIWWITLGLVGFTILSLLSKANGVLLPALAVVIEGTVMAASEPLFVRGADVDRDRMIYRSAMLLLGWLPSALIAGYLVYHGWLGLTQGVSSVRPWTLGQRLLTEPRVLMDYLHLLWLPRPFTPGLFNDQFHASTSLWSPASTLPSLLAVILLIGGALMCRRRFPTWSLAILFYFVGQSLESSTVSLELYFEHRNYLPAMVIFWPLALWLCSVDLRINSPHLIDCVASIPNATKTAFAPLPPWLSFSKEPKKCRSLPATWIFAKPLMTVALLLGLGLMTYASASIWGNTQEQARMWAALNPDSPRAQANAADYETNAGHPALAAARLKRALAQAPDQAQIAMNLFVAQCKLGRVEPASLIEFDKALRTTHDIGPLLLNWFTNEIDQVGRSTCPELTFETLNDLLDAAATNPNLNSVYGRRQDIGYLRGRLALRQGNADMALVYFNCALDEDAQISMALEQAAMLGSSGFPRQGLAHLDHYDRVHKQIVASGFAMSRLHAWILQRQNYWPKELNRLRDTLNEDAIHQVNAIHESCKSGEKNCSN